MTSPSTTYKVTLCKQEEDGLPVITPYNIHKKQYNQILKIIHEIHGGMDVQR